MSHLANPYHRPFEFPRPGPLLSPPDTDSEFHGQSHMRPMAPMGLGIDLEPQLTHRPASLTEVPISRKLQYIHSGPREARERIVQRSVRWLVVVTPPLSFAQEHGHFGHNLSTGSAQRLYQGVLLPLFPTMSSQLTAIAREFAFPSTAGLCLYLQTTHAGFAMTPRITDESWPLLWSHLFEPRSPTASISQLPIGGRIEFDIDLNKARWYEAWLGLARRDVDVPISVTPSRRGSVTHVREDSRTSIYDDQTDDHGENVTLLHSARVPRATVNKHVPRKLSLLDRLESSSVRSSSKLVPRNQSPPSPIALISSRRTHGLSPVVQEDEPTSARNDFVNSWRASSAIAPSPLVTTGQTSLDPVNMPNDQPIVEAPSVSPSDHAELDLNDFQWSVTSAGPADYEFDEEDFDSRSLESWRLPSVHLDRRAEGSVCLTPTTCTSFGPPDWDAEPMPDADFLTQALTALIPSPDIAARMLEDCPPTPSTATSWGPPLEYPPSPVRSEISYAQSVDIGQRCMSAVPLTPSTATSWGPPLDWPPSPATPYHVRTPDVGQRTFDIDTAPRVQAAPRSPLEEHQEPWEHVWPYTDASTTAPAEVTQPVSHPPAPLAVEEDQEPWRNVWPYIGTSNAVAPSGTTSPYTFVFPQRPVTPPGESSRDIATAETDVQATPTSTSETAVPQPQQPGPFSFGWPFFDVSTEAPVVSVAPPPERDVQPHVEAEDVNAEDILPVAPRMRKMSPFRFVFASEPTPRNAAVVAPVVREDESSGPWDHVWPYTDERAAAAAEVGVEVLDEQRGPWSHVWPYTEASAPEVGANDRTVVDYPHFSIYPAVYPHFDLYPEPAGQMHTRKELLSVYLAPSYPVVQPYHSVYPFLEIYPPVAVDAPAVREVVHKEPISMQLSTQYPTIEPYAPVYPWNVYSIYPSIEGVAREQQRKVASIKLATVYPALSIYCPVYPFLEIYPPVAVDAPAVREVEHQELISVKLPSQYPAIEPYASVYPWNVYDIYPSVEVVVVQQHKVASIKLAVVYPTLSLYDPVYPYNLDMIYPTVKAEAIVERPVPEPIIVRLGAAYPCFDLYPAVYPFNLDSIYPAVSQDVTSPKKSIIVHLPSAYPSLSLYSPVYPYNVTEIYPAVKVDEPHVLLADPIVVRLSGHYPNFEIYPAQYPWNLDSIYPSVVVETPKLENVVVELPLQYPNVQPYQWVYPYNLENIYPRISAAIEQPQAASRLETAKPKSAPVPAPVPARSAIKSHHGHHAKRSASASKSHVPPVPPLPQNVSALRPINPFSHQPLDWGRAGMPLPVQLSAVYPFICPYPSVYPHFDLYPCVTSEADGNRARQLPVKLEAVYPAIEIYAPVYPYLEIYPQATAEYLEQRKEAAEAQLTYGPRRMPKRTHLQLHASVFGSPRLRPEANTPPASPRKLPIPPQIRVPDYTNATPNSPLITPPRISPNFSSSNSPRGRTRSGTVSTRALLPTPPGLLGTPSPPPTPPHAESPTKSVRRLPDIPPNGSPRTSPILKSQIPRGLPTSPAASRRSLAPPPLSRSSTSSSSLSTLFSVPEPDAVSPATSRSPSVSPMRRPLPPQPSPTAPGLYRSGSASSRLTSASAASPQTGSDLSRTRSLPARPQPRARRDSVAVQPSSVVASLTKVYDGAAIDEKIPNLSSTLAQFPPPPRPSPGVPGSRPVSKLDISKYPFN